jgi:glutathione S-transferase
MIKVYHIPMFRSLRVVWLMEELGEDYELIRVPFPPEPDTRPPGFLGAAPTIVDGDIVMGESIAILQYLTGRRLQTSMALKLTVGPNPDPAAYAEHLQFLHLGEASLMTPLALVGRTRRMAPEGERSNYTAEVCAELFARRLGAVEQRLADGRAYLTGEAFTIADISVGYALAYAGFRGLDDLVTPGAGEYLKRLQARPAYQRAIAK